MTHNNKLIFYFIFAILPKFRFLLFNSLPTTDLLPCQFPSDSTQLASFCQLPYHQVPLICDPGGILSRTEAELIDRQLRTQVFSNLTSCICSLRPCITKDRRLSQLRVFGLLVPFANGNSVKNCQLNQKKNKNNNNYIPTLAELNRLTGQFARISLDRILTNSNLEKKEKCDPDLFFLYIDRWWTHEERQPFIARIYRRNLATMRDLSLVERVSEKGSPFEIMNEHLNRALILAKQFLINSQHLNNQTINPTSVYSPQEFTPSSTLKTEQIPLWAIFSALILVLMALIALLIAHLIARRATLAQQQKKFSSASRMSMRGARPEESLLTNTNTTITNKGITTQNINSSGGNTGNTTTSHQHLKSQMMFRQFNRKCQSTANYSSGGQTLIRQKI